ncbi:hypothetical protein BU26DRAFT_301585 [Trematosphaeria pertusa]|uniref:Uncharacterized protein n=1 Tax=Trematosphaeria pertusa TaxID=390896 RepID=A0A6A6IJ43_9PLEO|nr:uncharacterized protein BU26DRAFT_301585 [Trematosphaeria pertusa]KAF2250431.1 hypothetical protein BU26DRAFT_301585 [Trematosphaeria pertusa]
MTKLDRSRKAFVRPHKKSYWESLGEIMSGKKQERREHNDPAHHDPEQHPHTPSHHGSFHEPLPHRQEGFEGTSHNGDHNRNFGEDEAGPRGNATPRSGNSSFYEGSGSPHSPSVRSAASGGPAPHRRGGYAPSAYSNYSESKNSGHNAPPSRFSRFGGVGQPLPTQVPDTMGPGRKPGRGETDHHAGREGMTGLGERVRGEEGPTAYVSGGRGERSRAGGSGSGGGGRGEGGSGWKGKGKARGGAPWEADSEEVDNAKTRRGK